MVIDRALTGVDLTCGCHVACHVMVAGQSEAATWSSNHWVRGVVHSIAGTRKDLDGHLASKDWWIEYYAAVNSLH
ncbi:hypothetical protein Tco_0824675 [Tanacetum coccineum]|uniref:Uncharacterized protein n=1 Tax=Tanacetum coccineum TaxID=301880 RepID=A0ABQ5AMH9_9ASTR